ncbi:MAG: type IV-A pilus assembly ATPase PilB [Patescibacteria group bacterium]|nr:MAG: type IV-A pilus assembly ATPase PilB [Patescibacteria group bacterium]
MVIFDESKQKKQLKELREQEEEKLIKILSTKYGIPYIDLSSAAISNAALSIVKEEDARKSLLGVFSIAGKKIDVAIFSPNDSKTAVVLKALEERGYKISLYMASHASLSRIWARYKDISLTKGTKAGVLDISGGNLSAMSEKFNTKEDIRAAIEDALSSKDAHWVSRVFEVILGGAIAIGASDVHLEPAEEEVGLRYRLDGVLQNIASIDHKTYHLLISRIKLLSGLKLNITADTQDGRFSIKIKDADIEIRTSVLPGPYGETVVLRILNPEAISVSLGELGIEARLLSIIMKELKKPNGMILTTGPTGSGKTTSLYAFLKKVYSPEIKIITIEDPIEYHLKGITQTQVDKKSNYTFLNGLRAALRQDPDIIMVGEIRDGETAEIAVNSALTGHLVLSTLHTNNAAGTIPRLIDLGINPKVLSSALNISIAQRLIRKLCTYCKNEDDPTEEEMRIIKKVLGDIKAKRDDEEFSFDPIKVGRPVGCKKCSDTGYKGRIGLYEAILMDENLEKIMTENPNERDVKDATQGQGIFDMREDGIIKVLKGITSMEELGRVIEINEGI